MYKRQQKSKDLRDKKSQQAFSNTSLQNLYQILGKDTKQTPSEHQHHISIDSRYYANELTSEKLNVNLKYSPKTQQINQFTQDKMSIIQDFTKKAKRFYSQQKKKYNSLEGTNLKLKNMILRKKQQRKAKFFESETIQAHRHNQTLLQKQLSPNHQRSKDTMNAQNASLNRQAIKRYETDAQQRKNQAKAELSINNHFQRFKQSLKLKPLEFYIRKSKPAKFKIMGLSVKKYKRKVLDNTTQKMQQKDTQELQLSIINNEPKEQPNWKIQSIPLIISQKKHKFNSTNASKLRKKSSFEALINNCLPYLSISQHILWKMQQNLKFYTLVLLSFNCWVPYPQLNDLPKYQRKQVKYLYYVGSGNNRTLISELMEKRWYWKQTNNINQAHFVWTQQKIKSIHARQLSDNPQATILLYPKSEKQKQQKLKKKLCQAKQNQKNANLFKSYQYSSPNDLQEVGQIKMISCPSLLQNHLSGGKYLGNKKTLFLMLKLWFQDYQQKPSYLFSFIPQTFHVTTINCHQYNSFQTKFNSSDNKTLWIIKPAQNSNRGRGIFISNSLNQIASSVATRLQQGGTTIIQKYLSNLLLYHGRKFDIRTYLLCVTINNQTKFYWFSQGYLRTSSQPYSLKELSIMTHLTNDAIQNQGDQYGKFEKGNKLSYSQFQSYLDQNYSNFGWKMSSLLKQMKQIAKKIASASYPLINTQNNTGFELFGMDFIIDSSFKPWLLEVNTNPCLQLSSPLLQKLIPNVVENVVRLAVDPLFLPSLLPNKESEYTLPQKMVQWNKFQLIFDSQLQNNLQWEQILKDKWQTEKQQIQVGKADKQ